MQYRPINHLGGGKLVATTWAWPIKLMKKATGLVFGRADTRDSKPVAFFIGLGSQACEEGHRLAFCET